MEPSHESMIAKVLGHVQEEVTREREDGKLLRAPGYGANLELKYSACNFSAVCKEVTDLCRKLRITGKWEEAGMSYVAQISVSDGQVDEQDFRTLAELISALKASSMSSLRLANCGLTSEVAGLLFYHLFSTPVHWTRLDISHNRHFCFPELHFALECFDYFVRRNPLRVLNLNHTGFTNAHIQGILGKLLNNASSKRYLRILKIGPPVSGQGHGGSQDPEAGQLDLQTSQDLCSLLASHHSLQLLGVWGAEGELADTIIHAGLQAGLQREETETGCLRLKRLDFQDAEEHFREFDANILQSAMDVQEEAPAVEDPPAMDGIGPRHERARLNHHYNAERPATHGRAPFGGVSHGSIVPLVHRRRGHGKSKSRRHGTHRRPTNRGAGGDPNVAELPRKRRRHGPIAAHAAPHSQGARTNGTGTGSRTLARTDEGANASWDGAHDDSASQSYGEELGTSDTGGGTDSEDYSFDAHEQLHITRLEVGKSSGDSPDSPGEDLHMRLAGRGMSPGAAAAVPLAPAPLGPSARSPPSARQPDRPQRNHGNVADGSPARAPRHRRRRTPSAPTSPLRIPKDLVPFGFESRQSAEKHPPRGVFAAPDGPKRTRRRPAKALAALEVLRQQRGLTVQHGGGSHTDDASDSLLSGSEPDQDKDADSSDPESLLAVVQPVRIRRLQIPDSEDQEQAQVPVLATDMLAHADEEEAGQGMHAHSACSERWAAPEQQASPRQSSQALNQKDDEDSPGGSIDSAHCRTSPAGAAAAIGSQNSGLGRAQLHEDGEVDSSEHEAVSEDPAMKRRRKGSSAVDDEVGERAQLLPQILREDALQHSPVVQNEVAKQHSSAVSIESPAVQQPAQAVQRTARARRSEMERLMPFSWDKYLEKHPPNTEKLGVLMAESRDRRRPVRFSAARGIESGSPDDEDDPEDNIPLAKISVPATKQPTGAATATTPQDCSSGAAAQLVTGNPLSARGAIRAMQNTPMARSELATIPNPGGAAVDCMHPQLARAQSPIDNKALDSCKPDTANSPDDNTELRGAPSSVSEALASAGVAACDVLLNPGGKEQSRNDEMDDIVPDSEDEI
ncbi:g7975 [Coccomyxa elongata]